MADVLFILSYFAHWIWYRQDGTITSLVLVPSTVIEAFYKAIQQMVTQSYQLKQLKSSSLNNKH